MKTEIEYKVQFEPTALFKDRDNELNYNRIGLTTFMIFSLAANTLFGESMLYKEKDEKLNLVGSNSFTNIKIINTTNSYFEEALMKNSSDEDFFDFSMNPIYTNEFKIKVKSFKVEKFMPSSF
jgi:hypothetical protein